MKSCACTGYLQLGDCTSTYLIIHRKVYAYMDKTGNICFNFYLKTIYKKMQNKESQQTDAILRICFNLADASMSCENRIF